MSRSAVIALVLALAGFLTGNANGQSRVVVRSVADLEAAVAHGATGDTVLVAAGDYYLDKTLMVDRPLHLLGEQGSRLFAASGEGIMTVTADDVTIRGLTLQGVRTSFMDDLAALKLEDVTGCVVADNHFVDNFFAVYVARGRDCTIAGNRIESANRAETHSGNGIHLWYSTRMTVAGNAVSGHRDGIYFEFVEDSRVERNESRNNIRYGLHFMFSDRCDYEGNVFASNGAGVAVMYSEHVAVSGNTFADHSGSAAYGLLLKEIDASSLIDNVFSGNSTALYAEGSNRMTISGNAFVDNGWALKLMANCEDVLVSGNDFAANAFDVATNSRRTESTFDMNYWDEYEGYDLDRDGLGDTVFRPVSLFSLVVERHEPAAMLLGSLFVDVLDLVERVVPTITPANLVDARPRMAAQTPAVANAREQKQ